MITEEELLKNSPCLIYLKYNIDELILFVDYCEDDDTCYQCLLKSLCGDTYKEDIGMIFNWNVNFIKEFGELYEGTLTLNLKNEKV